MSVPASIITAYKSLQAQVLANSPVTNATHANVVAMQLNAANLVASLQSALTAPANILDTFSSPADTGVLITDIGIIVQAAVDQYNLSTLRAITGRVTSNLDQL